MADYTSANIDSRMVSSAIAAGVEFDTIQLRENAIPKSFETTYSWIFQDEPPVDQDIPRWHSFPKWLQDDSHEVYWITGKPGSGKSTIMKLILQHESLRDALSQSLGSLRPLLVKYYAWHPGSTLQKSLEGLKRTAIHQALKQRPELAPSLTPRRWAFCQVLRSTSGLPAWDSWEIEESFEALLSLCGKTIKLTLFVDGLDEFDTPPIEVVNCIRHIKARCHSGIKVCAASRPWTEFQDEFNDGPMLQMHLQTQEDMRDFITKSFAGNRGFLEQQQLRPEATSQLLADILQRANGVFLWVSIVTKYLLNDFSEGQSISQAQDTLGHLPTDLSSLYDVIWAGIRPQHLADASYMMQVLRAADGPLAWFIMWLIEESRFAPVDINALPTTLTWKRVAMKSLKRKLAARTKCILEVCGDSDGGYVDFIHRTARDWAVQPDKWELICALAAEDFDPHLSILQARTLMISDGNYGDRNRTSTTNVWDLVTRTLLHAGEVKDTPTNRELLVHSLNLLDAHLERLYRTLKIPGLTELVESGGLGWYDLGSFQLRSGDNNLIGLAAQFAVLPYVKAALPKCRRSFAPHGDAPGPLELAIFGSSYFSLYHLHDNDLCLPIPCERRLATVRYLLEQGVYQSRVLLGSGTCSLKDAIRRVSSKDPEYYTAVIGLLDQMGLKASAKSKGLRIKDFLEDMGHTSLSTVKLITDKKSL
ncbi:hypothetical protein BBK36DRAFT_1121703 [Trichoderma citrinoviride]|uniref:NACHT domain-containing protein n=1 Tax=Trichoderma citrinoviride TaxID=58853 RepID=A0A2T4B6Y0_9HYPO|nr:hypothetical protein BBK36DRAFT_1121703 [Trichoderma citrinoviride]PTB65093.1 hypothetical protein BBK36DRAFT_1121703 [Trichoderma citrinoviride]